MTSTVLNSQGVNNVVIIFVPWPVDNDNRDGHDSHDCQDVMTIMHDDVAGGPGQRACPEQGGAWRWNWRGWGVCLHKVKYKSCSFVFFLDSSIGVFVCCLFPFKSLVLNESPAIMVLVFWIIWWGGLETEGCWILKDIQFSTCKSLIDWLIDPLYVCAQIFHSCPLELRNG